MELVIGIVLVVVVISITSCGSKSKSLPKGPWGKTIACLEAHPLFLVTDGNSSSAASPGPHTTTVVINSQLHGYGLATIEDAGTPAKARAVVSNNGLLAPAANYNTEGSIVWAWNEGGNSPHVLSDGQDQADITNCINGG